MRASWPPQQWSIYLGIPPDRYSATLLSLVMLLVLLPSMLMLLSLVMLLRSLVMLLALLALVLLASLIGWLKKAVATRPTRHVRIQLLGAGRGCFCIGERG